MRVSNAQFAIHALAGAGLAANQVTLGVTVLAVLIGAASLVVRFRRARGTERQQLRWVALAAATVALAVVIVPAALALRTFDVFDWAAGLCVAVLPLAIGAAILRYRLYDLDRIISRTLAYGLLTVLLGGAYAGVVLGVGELLGQNRSLVVAGATLAAELLAVVDQTMQPARVSLWLRSSAAPRVVAGAAGGAERGASRTRSGHSPA